VPAHDKGGKRMRNKKSQKYAGYLTYEVFMSPAFRQLRPAGRDILIQVYFEIEMSSGRKRKKYTPVITNRDNIRLTYKEIRECLGYSNKTIWDAFKQLLAHGFLKVVKAGGGAKGDFQIYGITEDWRKWEKGQVIRTVQKNGKIGFQKIISSSVSKPLRSSVGKPPQVKNDTGLPTGKAV
jgi:hypothetical protein